jgi:RHS repeat-associated protein
VCADVDWPAQHTWAFRQYRRGYNGPMNWMGSLIYESRDASGLHYRRNRFYDAEAGRFTQEDPIGMAGGINVYGFGNGDPVGYSDPYGLSACPGIPGTNQGSLLDCPQFMLDWSTRLGAQAAGDWADAAEHSSGLSSFGASVMGHAAALWTPETYRKTHAVLSFGASLVTDPLIKLAADAASDGPTHRDLTILSGGEINKIGAAGVDVHDLKPDSRYDLYKARTNGDGWNRGDIYYMRKPKYGREDPVTTGHNINDF